MSRAIKVSLIFVLTKKKNIHLLVFIDCFLCLVLILLTGLWWVFCGSRCVVCVMVSVYRNYMWNKKGLRNCAKLQDLGGGCDYCDCYRGKQKSYLAGSAQKSFFVWCNSRCHDVMQHHLMSYNIVIFKFYYGKKCFLL